MKNSKPAARLRADCADILLPCMRMKNATVARFYRRERDAGVLGVAIGGDFDRLTAEK